VSGVSRGLNTLAGWRSSTLRLCPVALASIARLAGEVACLP
jgi:hypothetical protein